MPHVQKSDTGFWIQSPVQANLAIQRKPTDPHAHVIRRTDGELPRSFLCYISASLVLPVLAR
ncbi:hypothetical protein SLEP1_g31891 [Rubroshorea leprosula]|uniref:Uncharacterized protein n=1 Tax=Rubroshorea leprosula TaxID=152421 RepID=A0AAV5KBN0_9ROSI|nr:hypothetical protein SLEP1_g31891 [Rubroshorea leprosula]